MKNTPVDYQTARKIIDGYGLPDFGKATIREVVAISTQLEQETKTEFIHMEMGVPGLKAAQVGVDAEIKALQDGVASIYPNINGTSDVKAEASRFIKAFIDIDIAPEGCVPVTGSMQGTYASFLVCGQCTPEKDTILFIDPGFPVQKQQITVMGYRYESFDVYEYRGEKLRDILEQYLSKGNIAAMIYSNPNNPAWFCLTEEELKIIGDMANKYDTIVIEDLAYFAMDFRRDLSRPFEPPFQATVARYTDNYMLMLSASKIFSYAGQRMAVVCISDKLFNRRYPALAERYNGAGLFGNTFTNAIMYMITSGASHSVQFGLAAMYKAACDGQIDFVADTMEYGRRAEKMKRLFCENGFHVVYDKDVEQPIGDGFFFTIGYPGMTSGELMRELLYYGISSITLNTTGSLQEGIRACTSRMTDELFDILEQRLKAFKTDHPL